MHHPDSDGVIRSCTPLSRTPDPPILAGLTESTTLVIHSVTFYNSVGCPVLVRERWLDPNGEKELEQWFHVTDALAFVEGR